MGVSSHGWTCLRTPRGIDPRRVCSVAALLFSSAALAQDFADTVIDYLPAPGQFINNPAYNDPFRALGPPVGAGTLSPENTKVVSLGGFGGSITLAFSRAVLDDPCNPMGLDAIVFGNAFWPTGDPNRKWAEACTIEIARDDNTNGLADDAWYLIPGTHLPVPPAASLVMQQWDNDPGTAAPPSNIAWYPAPPHYPGFPSAYFTQGFDLPALFNTAVLTNPNGPAATIEGIRGYGDCSPTLILGDTNADNIIDDPGALPEVFYTRPDSPHLVGITPGSGGGDAFDIAWAVDPATGAPANLDRFHFIRLTSANDYIHPLFGDQSAEIGSVADVRPDPEFFDLNGDLATDVRDLYRWHEAQPSDAAARDLSANGAIDSADSDLLVRCIRAHEAQDMNPCAAAPSR